ncbi:MAG TPA: hypothetical protein VF635_04505, partial [Propionibacteriaceae bacterium]
GVAGGTAVLAQGVLEAVFGDQAVRRLAETAKQDLDARIQVLMADELMRYHSVLEGLELDAEHPARLRSAADEVGRARAEGLPTPGQDAEPALPAADQRLALEAPRISQVELEQALQGYPHLDIVDAELVEPQPAGLTRVHAEPFGGDGPAAEVPHGSTAYPAAPVTERPELRPEDLR